MAVFLMEQPQKAVFLNTIGDTNKKNGVPDTFHEILVG